MSDDLTTRLREIQAHQRPFHVFQGEVPAETIYGEAAARIEALEAELASYRQNFPCDGGCNPNDGPAEECSLHGRGPSDLWQIIGRVMAERDARDAVIAEALELWDTGPDSAVKLASAVLAVLSRVPQGAAEPTGCDVCAGVRVLDGRPMYCESCGAPIKFAGTTCENSKTGAEDAPTR